MFGAWMMALALCCFVGYLEVFVVVLFTILD